MNRKDLERYLTFAIIFLNYILEFLYVGARLIGLELWLVPIDLGTVQGQISYELYIFEGLFVAQLFLIWFISWRRKWRLQVKRTWHVIIPSVLATLLVIMVICVFTWDAGWPGMLERRLFAFELWILITALSTYVQVTFINSTGKR